MLVVHQGREGSGTRLADAARSSRPHTVPLPPCGDDDRERAAVVDPASRHDRTDLALAAPALIGQGSPWRRGATRQLHLAREVMTLDAAGSFVEV
jgi:hypothetical protein